jgi:hypothetical protein
VIQGQKKVIQGRKKEVRLKKSDSRSKKDLPVCLGVPQAIPLLWMIYYIVHGSMDHFLISGWVFLGV